MNTPNWKNRTIWTGDNLDIMRGMNSESVDLIYCDPPFNSNRRYSAPIGSEAAGAAFKDSWSLSDIDEALHGLIAETEPALYSVIDAASQAHGKSMKSYLLMMASRLLEMRRILKATGSLYLHCDPTASHYLKLTCDAIFGRANFRNEIIWCYTGPGSPKMRQFNRKHDVIFWYSISKNWCFNLEAVRINHDAKTKGNFKGKGSGFAADTYALAQGKVPETWWPQGKGNGLAIAARQKTQYVGYPTQKPLALLDRIIRASSNAGDTVLDPFCGCATACIAAERLEREWVGIDLSEKAAELVLIRADRELGSGIAHGRTLFGLAHRTDIPKRTDQGKLPPYKTHKQTLFGRQEGLCNGCRFGFPFVNFAIDHIVPRPKVVQTTSTTCNCYAGRVIA